MPVGAFGVTAELARALAQEGADYEDVGGVGGTLAGNALSLAAVRATLGEVLTEEAFARMTALGERLADGVAAAIAAAGLPWHVTRLGARAEYRFSQPPRNGGESAAAGDEELERFLHLYALNRGVLITPFHNMALVSPATTAADVDRHTEVFAAALGSSRERSRTSGSSRSSSASTASSPSTGSRSRSPPARSSPCSGRPGAARRRRCG